MLSTEIGGKKLEYIFIPNEPPKATLPTPDMGTNEPPDFLVGIRGLIESN